MRICGVPDLRGGLPLLLLLGPAAAMAAEAPAGAASCAGCHAVPARAGAAIPSLQGTAPEAIAAAMRDYRSGARPATVMDRIAKGFSEEESRPIATWVAGP
jgi:cytochrome c553